MGGHRHRTGDARRRVPRRRRDPGRRLRCSPAVREPPEKRRRTRFDEQSVTDRRRRGARRRGRDREGRALADGFYVADDGPGIPAEERDAVTEQGYTTAESGSGSGLAIVSEIATDNEWDLVVTESESGGARFEFRNVMLVAEHPGPTIAGASHELDEAVDVGAVTTGDRGTYDAEADRWTIESDGTNIWQHDNGFHYVFTRVSGDVRIEGRVRDVERVIDYSKAGFMIRSGTDEDCAYGHVGATAAQGSEVLWRGRPGAGGRSQLLGDDADRFEYYRIDRVGDTVTCSVSRRGKTGTRSTSDRSSSTSRYSSESPSPASLRNTPRRRSWRTSPSPRSPNRRPAESPGLDAPRTRVTDCETYFSQWRIQPGKTRNYYQRQDRVLG
ncbi:ATP-binding protein [Halosimplex aquaticum]